MQLKRAHADKLLYMNPDDLLHFESRPEAVSHLVEFFTCEACSHFV